MTKNKAKELAYDLFFILMIFAKGIGLDSGSRLYYILSAAACLCVGVKLVLTKYKVREIVAMALLCAMAFLAYRNSGRLGIVLSVLTIIGLKDMDVKKLFRLGTLVYGVSFAFTVLAAKFGITANPLVVHEKGGVELIRWGMGYSTANVFHVSYFMLAVLLCSTWRKGYNWKKMLGLMLGNLLVYLYSLSYTGVLVTAFYLLLNLYAVKRKRLCMAERIICQLPLPLCLLFSFGAPFCLQYPVAQKLDHLLQARLTFSAYYLQNQPITLFGTRMKDVPNFWIIMDNSYVYFFMTFGIVAFVLFCAGYAVVIGRYSGLRNCLRGSRRSSRRQGEKEEVREKERLPELAMIFSFLLYGIMEQFLSNAFMNFSLLFFGEVLFGRQEEVRVSDERKGFSDWKRRCLECLVCGVAGVGIFVLYFVAVPRKECIPVPLKSLNYVQAQSVQIGVKNEAGTEEELENRMEEYRNVLESSEMISAVLRETGIEYKISAEELTAALEYSVPVSVYDSGNYDMFRVRILELYYDMTQEEYGLLLDRMIASAQETEAGQYSVKNGVYYEVIGKSFGEDRIEHISEDKVYEVEKVGDIVEMEHVRDGMFNAVLGVMALMLLWNIGAIYGKRKRN